MWIHAQAQMLVFLFNIHMEKRVDFGKHKPVLERQVLVSGGHSADGGNNEAAAGDSPPGTGREGSSSQASFMGRGDQRQEGGQSPNSVLLLMARFAAEWVTFRGRRNGKISHQVGPS